MIIMKIKLQDTEVIKLDIIIIVIIIAIECMESC